MPTHNIEERIAATVRQQRAEDEAGREAAAVALPGPLANAFAPQPLIMVGKYSVRPIYDVDFEFFQHLGHPFAAFAVGNTSELESFVPSGKHAWNLFWILTTPVDEVDDAFSDLERGQKWVEAEARREFSRYQIGALFALYRAVVQQITSYAKTVLEYAPETGGLAEEAKEAAAASRPPSGEPLTASAG